ncbi:unnamed protein product [Somion occarium]|uniref:2-dehydropantoate 2-reductase n=1 Tax=Somion occarium TaxID=3059160 RepID=A0ABP1DZR4_9APHY
MPTNLKEILLVGYGAVGAVYALILKRSGLARVTVVARSNYNACKADGMHFRSQKYGNITGWRPDRLCASVAEAADQAYSHVILTTKVVPEIQTTPELLSPFLSSPYSDKFSQPIYVLMQNGLGIETGLYRTLKGLQPSEEPRIIGTSVYIGTRLVEKNIVEHNYFDRVQMGICRSTPNVVANTPEEIAILTQFGDILQAGGTDLSIVPEIQRIKFEKNIWNCVFGPAAVLARHSLQSFLRPPQITSESPDFDPSILPHAKIGDCIIPATSPIIAENTIPFLYETLKEVCAVGNALFPSTEGEPVFSDKTAQAILERTSTIFVKPTSTEKPSILVDVESGRPMELEVIVGEVVRTGRRLGVSIPRLETFYAMMAVTQTQLLQMNKTPS